MVAIAIQNLSKKFYIYTNPIKRLLQYFIKKELGKPILVLDKINLEINKGDSVGVIGVNGSGKSTLLQIISGTLSESAGSVSVDGRIAALLELGAGFNAELTGIENIYISASIYGFSPNEIDEKVKSIISFADIGQYIYEPVKNYSSGMYVRLAFAVAAHVDADILIIDEALSVGDAIFTQKCMRYIRKFKEKGTILFVSHDINAVAAFCNKAIWIDKGLIKEYGQVDDVIKEYTNFCIAAQNDDKGEVSYSKESYDTGELEIIRIDINPAESNIKGGEPACIKISMRFLKNVEECLVGFNFKDRLGQVVFGAVNKSNAASVGDAREIIFDFRMPKLNPGSYSVSYSIAEGDEENHRQMLWHHDVKIYKFFASNYRYGIFELEQCESRIIEL